MKIVHAERHNAAPRVPILGGHQVRFNDHRAVVRDDVADTLVAMGGGFYRILAHDLSEIAVGAQILIVRDGGMGDLLLLTPLIRRLALDRGAIVDVETLAHHRCVFDNNPYVRQTFAMYDPQPKLSGLDRSQYDVVLDLNLVVENEEASGQRKHRAESFAEQADVRLYDEDMHLDYVVTDDEREAFQERFSALEKTSLPDGSLAPVIAYCWRSSTANRNWSEQTHRAVIAALLQAGYVIILIDPHTIGALVGELIENGNLLDWSGQLSIREVAAVVDGSDVVITPDTGVFHIAGALGKPTVSYFGAFPVEKRHTHRQLTVLNNPSSCPLSPCYSYQCLVRDENGQARCLAVDPEEIVSRLKELLSDAHILERSAAERDAVSANCRGEERAGGDDRGLDHDSLADDPGEHPALQRQAAKPAGGRRARRD